MRHWWNRTPEEQEEIARWVRGEAPPPLATKRQAEDQERAAYRQARATKRCRCDGSGQALLTQRTPRGLGGRTVPCPYCRPADHAAAIAAIRKQMGVSAPHKPSVATG